MINNHKKKVWSNMRLRKFQCHKKIQKHNNKLQKSYKSNKIIMNKLLIKIQKIVLLTKQKDNKKKKEMKWNSKSRLSYKKLSKRQKENCKNSWINCSKKKKRRNSIKNN